MYRFRKKGLVYILNNYIFYKRSPGTVGRERKGSEIDLQNVKHLFTQLGYEPVVDKDLKADVSVLPCFQVIMALTTLTKNE